jgi:PAS domain S-box-containing protein
VSEPNADDTTPGPPAGTGPAFIHETMVGEILRWDDAMHTLTGWSAHEVLRSSGLDLVHPDDHETAVEAWVAMLQDGRCGPRRWRTRGRDGTYRWHEVTLDNQLVGDDGGHVLLAVHDVHDRVAAAGVDETTGTARNGADGGPPAPPHGTIHENMAGGVLWWDDGMAEMTGWSPEEVKHGTALNLIHPDDHSTVIRTWMEMVQVGRSGPQRWRARRRNGTYQWHEVVVVNRLEEPDHGYVLLEVSDVTEEMAADGAPAYAPGLAPAPGADGTGAGISPPS